MFNGQFIPALELMNVPGKMIRMKNFSGNERRAKSGKITNTFGQRNFVVKFDEEQGKALEAQGWDIFWFPHESEEQPLEAGLTVPVNLSDKNQRGEDRHPDEVIVVTETERVRQNEKTIGNLDGATIISADMRLIPREKRKNDGQIKIAPVLYKMYVKIATDRFDTLYDDRPMVEPDYLPPFM
jgi:hypothetical protein